jgi:hypothetical protein
LSQALHLEDATFSECCHLLILVLILHLTVNAPTALVARGARHSNTLQQQKDTVDSSVVSRPGCS